MENKERQKVAIDTLIHDTNGPWSAATRRREYALQLLKEGDYEGVKQQLEGQQKQLQELQQAIDAYYVKYKNNFE